MGRLLCIHYAKKYIDFKFVNQSVDEINQDHLLYLARYNFAQCEEHGQKAILEILDKKKHILYDKIEKNKKEQTTGCFSKLFSPENTTQLQFKIDRINQLKNGFEDAVALFRFVPHSGI